MLTDQNLFALLATHLHHRTDDISYLWETWENAFKHADMPIHHEWMVSFEHQKLARFAAITQGTPTLSAEDRFQRMQNAMRKYLDPHVFMAWEHLIVSIFPSATALNRFSPNATALYAGLGMDAYQSVFKGYINSRLTDGHHAARVTDALQQMHVPPHITQALLDLTASDHIHWRGIGCDIGTSQLHRPKIYIQSDEHTLMQTAAQWDPTFDMHRNRMICDTLQHILAPRSELALHPLTHNTKLTFQIAGNADPQHVQDVLQAYPEFILTNSIFMHHDAQMTITRISFDDRHKNSLKNIYFVI